jgi:hypothetical protein
MMEDLGRSLASLLESPSALVEISLGSALLLFGRRLFWLLIGLLGFAAGFWLADSFLRFESLGLRLRMAAALGVLGALAAVFLQKVAIAAGGALVAAYSAWWYLSLGRPELEVLHWLLVAGAAIVGLLLARLVAEVALIALSTLAGATLVLQALDADPDLSRWLFIGLLILGAAVQGPGFLSRRRSGTSRG